MREFKKKELQGQTDSDIVAISGQNTIEVNILFYFIYLFKYSRILY